MSRKLSLPVDDESSDIIKRYEKFLSGDAKGYFDVEEMESIVEYYLRRGRTSDCSKALELGLQLHPNSNALKTKRAKIYLATGDNQKAYRILDTLSESTDYEVILLKIEVLLKLERIEEARLKSDQLLIDEKEDLANVALDIAFIFIGQGDYELALSYLLKGDEFDKRNTDLLYELAFCYEQCARFDEALVTYNRIIDIDSFSGEAWFNLGQIQFAMQNFTDALEAYEFALAIDENDSLSWLQKAHACFQLDRFEDAIDAYKEYGLLTNTQWETFIFVAECYEKLERYEDAIENYKLSLNFQAENYDALTGIAICLLDQEKYAESIPYIEKALEVNPEASDAWVYLAEALIGIDDINLALASYLKAISIDPEQPETLMAIANIYLEKGLYDQAIDYYKSGLILDETLEFANLFVAVAYMKKQDYADSLYYLKKAMEQNPAALELFQELCPETLTDDPNEL